MTSELAEKPRKLVQSSEGGVVGVAVEEGDRKRAVLGEDQAVSIAVLLVRLEEEMGRPQDFEWAIEAGEKLLSFAVRHSLSCCKLSLYSLQ